MKRPWQVHVQFGSNKPWVVCYATKQKAELAMKFWQSQKGAVTGTTYQAWITQKGSS